MAIEHLERPDWCAEVQVSDNVARYQQIFSAYISGPMTNRPRFNFDAFDEAEERGGELGWAMVSPAAHDREVFPDIETWEGFAAGDVSRCPAFDFHRAMIWDLQEVAKADAIVLLPGWSQSTGAGHELDVALACGKRIFVYLAGHFDEIDAATCAAIRQSAGEESPSGEHRVTDPTTGGAKGSKDARYDLIPADALNALAEHYGRGAKKYEARNWERGYAWSLSFAALQRHAWSLWNGELVDSEGFHHATAIAFHAFALYRFSEAFPELDDRPSR